MKYLFFLFLPPFAHFTRSQAVRLSVPRLHRSSRKAKSFSTQTQLNLFLASIHQSQGQNGPPSLPIQEPCSRPNTIRIPRTYTKLVKYANNSHLRHCFQLISVFPSRISPFGSLISIRQIIYTCPIGAYNHLEPKPGHPLPLSQQ